MRLLILACLLLAGCTHVNKQVARDPVPAETITPKQGFGSRYGNVEASWPWGQGDLFTVKWDGLVVYQEQMMLKDEPKVTQNGRVGNEDYILLESYRGDGCPVTIVLITMGEFRNYKVHQFGNCMQPQIGANTSSMSFDFKAFPAAGYKAQRWEYKNGQLKRTNYQYLKP